MENLKELISICKASVGVSINDHKDFYESVEAHIPSEQREYIDPDIFNEMVKRDTIVRVQAYPDSPVGCYIVYHYDVEFAIYEMLRIIKEQ